MDGYTIDIDELQDNLVVLAVPTLRLLVFGRALHEAMRQARASIDFRLLETGARPDRRGADAGPPGSKATAVAA